MADRFDVVSVGVQDEGAVVAGMVVRTLTGRAVVGSSRCQGGLMEGVHLLGGVRTQGEVDGGKTIKFF